MIIASSLSSITAVQNELFHFTSIITLIIIIIIIIKKISKR